MPFSTASGATPIPCSLNIEGIQTIVPTKPTDPRKSFKVHAAAGQNPSSAHILQRRFHALFCYDGASGGEDSGWQVAGRIKESLGAALQEQPLLAGRVQRCEEAGMAALQVVSNDSGIRLVEAAVEMTLDDFVGMTEKREAEAKLVFGEDVEEDNPQFSPLFYVQVTNFTCGGYSVGICCSILLEDPFSLTTFLKKWANIHQTMSSRADTPKIPTFYLPHHGKPRSSPSLLTGPNTFNHAAETIVFKIPTKILDSDSKIHKNLAALCVQEAGRGTGLELSSSMALFLKAPPESDLTVEICSRRQLMEIPSNGCDVDGVFGCVRTWDELELESVCFNEGKKPVYVNCWINSVAEEGLVMVVPFDANNSEVQILVTFT